MKISLPPAQRKKKVVVEEVDKTELKLMLFPSQIQKISNMISLLAHQRDVMRRFTEKVESGSGKSSLTDSFEWKSQLQYQWDESSMGINVKWSGRREIIHELSMSLGRPLYMFNCSKTLDSFMLADIFKGLSCT
ncbi:uncharacterized protein LOC144341589, partial [Saccoglossus kowalevskii]